MSFIWGTLVELDEGVLFMAFFSNDYGQFMAIPSRVLSGDFMNQLTNEASLQIETLVLLALTSHEVTRASSSKYQFENVSKRIPLFNFHKSVTKRSLIDRKLF